MTGEPLVRAVVVNFNGGNLTLDCLRSLRATDWPSDRLETVLVDNGSAGGFLDSIRTYFPEVTVLEASMNLGFTGGCNLAFRHQGEVDFVALVNNDATVDPGWLAPLVAAFDGDTSLGAASPKILFAGSFLDVVLESETMLRGRGDRRALGVRVSGLRAGCVDLWRQAQLVSGFWGPEGGLQPETTYQWTTQRAELRVPIAVGVLPPDAVEVRLAADRPTHVVLTSGAEAVEVVVGVHADWFKVPLAGTPYNVINSAGSILVEGEYGADRGYLEPDQGQYDEPVDVFAWSGAAVVLSQRYLDDVGLFDERFFLYYEDFDLAWRGRARGWRYRYVPQSTVRHLHSASTDESSALFAFHNERNRLLTLARNATPARAATASVRSLLITASYARRDILSPLLRRRRPAMATVLVRLRAFLSFLRLLPGTVASRRRT